MQGTHDARRYGRALWLLLALFVVRVVAQPAQRWLDIAWLPPFDAWQSGVLPYRTLVLAQFVILVLQARVAWRISSARVRASLSVARWTLALGAIYLVAMMARLGLGMTLLAGHRWFGARLPTVFHLVLASFVLVVGFYHRQQAQIAQQGQIAAERP